MRMNFFWLTIFRISLGKTEAAVARFSNPGLRLHVSDKYQSAPLLRHVVIGRMFFVTDEHQVPPLLLA